MQAVFAARGNATAIRALNPLGCQQVGVNSQRGGFVVNPDGTVEERSGRYFNVDVRVTKSFRFGGALKFKLYSRPLQPVQHREPVLRQQRRASA